MPAPTWDQYMIPALHVLVDGQMRRTREIVDRAADLLQWRTDRQSSSSGQEQWKNRGNWALSYLARAGAVSVPRGAAT